MQRASMQSPLVRRLALRQSRVERRSPLEGVPGRSASQKDPTEGTVLLGRLLPGRHGRVRDGTNPSGRRRGCAAGCHVGYLQFQSCVESQHDVILATEGPVPFGEPFAIAPA